MRRMPDAEIPQRHERKEKDIYTGADITALYFTTLVFLLLLSLGNSRRGTIQSKTLHIIHYIVLIWVTPFSQSQGEPSVLKFFFLFFSSSLLTFFLRVTETKLNKRRSALALVAQSADTVKKKNCSTLSEREKKKTARGRSSPISPERGYTPRCFKSARRSWVMSNKFQLQKEIPSVGPFSFFYFFQSYTVSAVSEYIVSEN